MCKSNEWYPIVYSYMHNDLSYSIAELGYKQTSWGQKKGRTRIKIWISDRGNPRKAHNSLVVSRERAGFPETRMEYHSCKLCRSYFGASPEQLLPPFTTHGLETADNICALLACFAVLQPAVPVADFEPT